MLSEPMDIVYLLAASYARGGIKIQIEQANRLAQRGHNVRILSSATEPDWIDLQVQWERVEIPNGHVLGQQLPPCQLVVFSFYEQAFGLLKTVSKTDAVPIFFAQGDEIIFGRAEDHEEEAVVKDITAAQHSVKLPYPILTVSEAAADKIKSFGGKNITVVPNGIDRSIFHPDYPKPEGPLRILSVGAEFPKFKGISELYAALIKMQNDPEVPEFIFVRAAPKDNLFAELPIEVEYHSNPSQEHLASLYAGADLFVGSSHEESFYLTPLEAMSCGTAVVCSDLPAVRTYAQPGRDYISFQPGNIPEMYRCIKEALRTESLREQLVIAGLSAAAHMDWGVIIKRIEKYFRDQLSQKEKIQKRIRREIKHPTVPFSFEPRKKAGPKDPAC